MNRLVICCLGALLVTVCAVTVKEGGAQAGGSIITLDPAFQRIAPADARVEKVAGHFKFVEGPLWDPAGFLLFSDIDANQILKWTPDGTVTTFRKPSDNSNGLTFDPQGRLIACEIGNRRVSRTEKDGTVVTLADRYNGKRLNSPNDVVVRSDGSIYFTDPPYRVSAEVQELPFYGVFRISPDGKLTLLVDDFEGANGLAFSPDEKTLYIADYNRDLIRAFDVSPDGTLTHGRVFVAVKGGSPDGMKVDTEGNVYSTGSGGVLVYNAQGKHLGTLKMPEVPANLAWGDADAKTLYLTNRTGLYRIRLSIPGIRP